MVVQFGCIGEDRELNRREFVTRFCFQRKYYKKSYLPPIIPSKPNSIIIFQFYNKFIPGTVMEVIKYLIKYNMFQF